MKSISIVTLLLFFTLLGSCVQDNNLLKKGNGEVVINTMTRGGYQFLIRFEDKLYYPINLPESYKTIQQEPILIFVIFSLTGEKADIFGPAPNDVPVYIKSIPEINITNINRRN